MMQILVVFMGVLIISLGAHYTLSQGKRILGPFYPIVLRIGYLGVLVHECAHYSMSLVVGRKPDSFSVKWRDEKTGIRSPQGAVAMDKPPSFLQAIVICFAPLYISTWLIFLCLRIALSSDFDPYLRILSGVLFISLLIGAAPSSADFMQISNAIHNDPSNSLYQIVLIFVSAGILWVLLQFTPIIFTIDEYYFFTIAGFYLILKFSIKGFKFMVHKINPVNYAKPTKIKFKRLTRQHYRPKKPRREW